MRRLVVVLLAARLANADEGSFDDDFADAKSLKACRATYATLMQGAPTAAARGISTAAATCTRKVMNAKVDQVLLPLKKQSKDTFKLGMTVQKLFNQAVTAYCAHWDSYYRACCVTCSYNERPECEMEFHSARVAQVELALKKQPPAATTAATRDTLKRFDDFATQWCAQLEAQGVAVSDTCSAHVLGGLQSSVRDDGVGPACNAK